jgi:hypothetical protein
MRSRLKRALGLFRQTELLLVLKNIFSKPDCDPGRDGFAAAEKHRHFTGT